MLASNVRRGHAGHGIPAYFHAFSFWNIFQKKKKKKKDQREGGQRIKKYMYSLN